MSSASQNLPFAAVLLAGGRSTRMGRDKAGIEIDGQMLWQRQLEKLRVIEPAELFISGRPDGPFAGAGVEIVIDAEPGLGPLAGIVAALRRTNAPLLLVLAIDLPDIHSTFLRSLINEACARRHGVIPQSAKWFEPLAAVYPRAALPFAEETLRAEDRSLQSFVRSLLDAGIAGAWPLSPAHLAQFRNVNTPVDL